MAIVFSPSGMTFRQELSKPGKDEEVFKFKKKAAKKCGGAQAFSVFANTTKSMKKL